MFSQYTQTKGQAANRVHAMASSLGRGPHLSPVLGCSMRESMRGLPRAFQPLLTWLVGKPLEGEARWKLRPWHHLASCLAALGLGLGFSAVALTAWGLMLPMLLLAGWVLTVHGMRKLRTMILHQCSHTNFTRNPVLDGWLGDTISFVLCTEAFAEYR